MPEISWSEVKLFRRCMAAHDYKYHQQLKRRRKAAPLIRGTILHDMLDAFHNQRKIKTHQGPGPWDVLEKYEEEYSKLFDEEQELYGDMIGDCGQLFENYLSFYKNDPLEYEESETFVATDLAENLRYIGYIDKVAVDEQGRRWLVDHKFVKTIPSAEDEFPELQLLMYLWAWNRFNPGRPVVGIIWDYVRTKLPVVPEVLKKGGLSQRKNMDTTPQVYLKAIHDNGLDPLVYAEMLEHLQGKEDSFFHRSQLPRPSEKMITSIVSDFRSTALMIQKLKGIAPRNMNNFNCKTCEFRPLCEAETRGQDVEYIKKTEYVSRNKGKEVEHAEEEN